MPTLGLALTLADKHDSIRAFPHVKVKVKANVNVNVNVKLVFVHRCECVDLRLFRSATTVDYMQPTCMRSEDLLRYGSGMDMDMDMMDINMNVITI